MLETSLFFYHLQIGFIFAFLLKFAFPKMNVISYFGIKFMIYLEPKFLTLVFPRILNNQENQVV
jgi:hypothetical protein